MESRAFDHRSVLLLEEQPSLSLPADSTPVPNKVSLTSYTCNRIDIDVETAENGLLWVSEIWYPAWKAYVDRKRSKIYRADYSFRAVEIPKGSHRVTLRFQSGYFAAGAWITLLTLAAAAAALVLLNRKPRVAPAGPQ
jgi:uncharacterized membrane protein YfhO